MCYTLGYNRDKALVSETSEKKRRRVRLVWLIVMIDKCLSLRLGRPSTFRDNDLTLARLKDSDSEVSIVPAMSKYIDIALLQGKIYDDIFSSGALLQPESIRVSRARALAVELQAVYDSTTPAEVRYLTILPSVVLDNDTYLGTI